MIDNALLQHLESFLTPERKQRFVDVLSLRTRYLTVAAEDVFQMHNASAMVRSCDVFGLQEVHLIEGRFGHRLDKNIAMGAQQWVDVIRHNSTVECVEYLRDRGYLIVATVPGGEAIDLEDFHISEKTALLFGTEKEGLSDVVLEKADALIRIPMVGFSESLNVSVSAAIIIQKIAADLRRTNLPWSLGESEILEKRFDWTCKTIKNVDQIIERFTSRSKKS